MSASILKLARLQSCNDESRLQSEFCYFASALVASLLFRIYFFNGRFKFAVQCKPSMASVGESAAQRHPIGYRRKRFSKHYGAWRPCTPGRVRVQQAWACASCVAYSFACFNMRIAMAEKQRSNDECEGFHSCPRPFLFSCMRLCIG